MSLLSYISTSILSLFFAWYLLPLTYAHSYFIVTEPTNGVQWTNGASNAITWTKGLLDGINAVDIELARLSTDGLIFVARDVPAASGSLNLFLQDIPTGDDYYLLFLNSTHGVLYAASQRFAIGSSSNGSAPSPIASAATVTVSGAPNPTAVFATTFPPSANGVATRWRALRSSSQLFALLGVMATWIHIVPGCL
ncbi:hypothetical protein A0H81_05627 [Grifola frondosa]|uniref:Uncharacterized protein n=1 Tax=Grifola frondosa TaxID=5627 RepID=A0A1C7MD30_GRIFR|nr:hypothetical protein A0H81_05627 [Grifola frondosa]